ncbi:MAG TPA: hypothetical protein VGV34_01495, partial [Solirubrobacterales bacterium]|nr:hypothetical protein [Solirubrobacterales bacterium]
MRRPGKRALGAALAALALLAPTSALAAETPEIDLNASGEPWRGASPYAEVEGTIDAHNHVTAYVFLGGDAHCGEPWNP